MLMGFKCRAYPSAHQAQTLNQWIGCSRVIWNAKCDQWRYESTYARKYLPIGTYAAIDASYSQFKNKEQTPFLYEVPSQILRNAANSWRDTQRDFINPHHPQKGPAHRKKKGRKDSVYITNELFTFEKDEKGKLRLFLGTPKFPVGEIAFHAHHEFSIPKSLTMSIKAGKWYLSFNYNDSVDEAALAKEEERLKIFQGMSQEELEIAVVGVDRGVKVPVQTDKRSFQFTEKDLLKQEKRERYIAKYQKKLARQQKGSKRRDKTKQKIARLHQTIANVRENFCHQTSHALTKEPGKLIVMENLKTSQMTKRPKPKKDEASGKWLKNKAAQKAGLNKAILSIGWYKLETYTKYKAFRRNCLLVKISPQFTSQECADCGHIHPDNRLSQAEFVCLACGHRDNADRNAALVIKKRAINMLVYSGTELSDKGILSSVGTGHGAVKTSKPKARKQRGGSVKNDGRDSYGPPEAQAL